MNQDVLLALQTNFPGRLRGEEYFVHTCSYCGNCNNNLQVNVEKLVYHCWSCGAGGTLRKLFIDFNLPTDSIPSSVEYKDFSTKQEKVTLPKGCLQITSGTMKGSWVIMWLGSRGVTIQDIQTYGLMYTEAGKVVVPLQEDGDLVYYVERAFVDWVPKYGNPAIDKSRVASIFFGTVDRLTLILVEGVWDAIAMHKAGYSAMPLLGTQISSIQVEKIRKRNFTRYVVLLDSDASGASAAVARVLHEQGLEAYIADTAGPDPDELDLPMRRQVVENAKKYGPGCGVLAALQQRRRLLGQN